MKNVLQQGSFSRKMRLLGGLLVGMAVFSACSPQGFYQKKTALSRVERGMTPEEVREILGEPDYRRFDPRLEEWEYRKWLSGNDAVVVVTFQGGGVIALDSFERPQPFVSEGSSVGSSVSSSVSSSSSLPVNPTTSSSSSSSASSSSYSTTTVYWLPMKEAEFSRVYEELKAERFTNDRYERIQALARSRSLTCRQCALLLKFYAFSKDKMETLRLFAPHLVDRENYREIQKEFSFSIDQEKVKEMLGF